MVGERPVHQVLGAHQRHQDVVILPVVVAPEGELRVFALDRASMR